MIAARPVKKALRLRQNRVHGVGARDALGVAGVPGVLGGLHLGQGAFPVERR